MKSRRAGFTLVEVVVALFVLAVGAFGIAGVAATASRMLARAGAREGAAAAAVLVMDSLLAENPVSGGNRDVGRFGVEWTIQGGMGVQRIELTVNYRVPGRDRERKLSFAALHTTSPPLVLATGSGDP